MERKIYRHILIDILNLFHRHYHIQSKSGEREEKVLRDTIKATLKGINKYEKDFLVEGGEVWLLFDNPTSRQNLRSEMSEDYKRGRKKMPLSFYKASESLKSILLNYKHNFNIAYAESLEADDLVKPILENIDPLDSVLLISSDMDWSRTINYKKRVVDWFDLSKKDIINYDEFNRIYGFYPSIESVSLYKTITGDSIDNIPIGVKNIQKKDVVKLCNEYKSVFDIMQNLDKISYLSKNIKQKFVNNLKQLRINESLVAFMDVLRLEKYPNEFIYNCKFNPTILKILLKKIDMIDDRIKTYVSKKKPMNVGFFEQPDIPRR